MHRQRVTVHDTRHHLLRNNTIILDAVHYIIKTSARGERTVTMIAYIVYSAILHRFVYDKHFRQVILAFT